MCVCFVTLSTPKPSRLHALIQRSDCSRSTCGFGNGMNVDPFMCSRWPYQQQCFVVAIISLEERTLHSLLSDGQVVNRNDANRHIVPRGG